MSAFGPLAPVHGSRLDGALASSRSSPRSDGPYQKWSRRCLLARTKRGGLIRSFRTRDFVPTADVRTAALDPYRPFLAEKAALRTPAAPLEPKGQRVALHHFSARTYSMMRQGSTMPGSPDGCILSAEWQRPRRRGCEVASRPSTVTRRRAAGGSAAAAR